MECHERALMNQEPLSTYYTKYCKGLLQRGLITSKVYKKDDKTLECFFITPLGIDYLRTLEKTT